MAQVVTALATKCDDLSLIPETWTVEGENGLLRIFLRSCMLTTAGAQASTHAHKMSNRDEVQGLM